MKQLYTVLFAILLCHYANAQAYNYYFGNLHSHSDYSDGNQDKATSGLSLPWQDFNYAKASYHMDFLGISEHNHSATGMSLANYSKGLTQADTTSTASFVGLYGMEWGVTTNSYDGHAIIYGVNQLIGWEAGNYDVFCAKSDYPSLWPIIAGYPNSFATICHPSNGQFQNLDGTAYSAAADNVLVGSVVRSGSAFSTTTNYSDVPPTNTFYEAYYNKLLSKGYHIGPVIDHDNHNTTFGRTAHTRTVVLASSLTQANVIDAYRNMRFYASDDWNAQVSFTINANPMGSVVNTYANSSINVTVTDPDAGDNVNSIQVYYGIPGSGTAATLLTSNSASSTLIYSHTTAVNDLYYYYVKITQTDGDIIWTAPIWITRLNSALPVSGLTLDAFEWNDQVKVLWKTLSEYNTEGFDIEKSFRGNDFHSIGHVRSVNAASGSNYEFIDSNAVAGTQFYRLKQIDNNGTVSYSPVVSVTVKYHEIKLVSAAPNPVKNDLTIRLQSAVTAKILTKIYNAEGRLVMALPANVLPGSNNIIINAAALQAGVYFTVIEKDNLRILETKFVKE